MEILKPDPKTPFMSAVKFVIVAALLVGTIDGVLEGFLGIKTNLSKEASPALGLMLFGLYFYFRSKR